MSKCDVCNKNITKSSLGLECGKCERIVHLNPKCAGLSNKQIAAIKAAPNLEWTCPECQQEIPRRNSSIIAPEEEDDEDDTPVKINAKKLLSNISIEVEKTIKSEMRQLNDSLQFHSAKLDEAMECIEAFKKTIKNLERKNTELTNKNNNLETRVGVLEQRLQEIEQEKLANCIEIANVPNKNIDDVQNLVDHIAIKLNQPKEDVKYARKLYGQKDCIPNILVEFPNDTVRERWLMAAKNRKLTVEDILPTENNGKNTIYIREAMTKYNKQLFWNTKQELKGKLNFKYVWFKQGIVKARKEDGAKIFIIRSIRDLHLLSNSKE